MAGRAHHCRQRHHPAPFGLGRTSPVATDGVAASRLRGFGPYVDEHLAAMARLHRENRYDRRTTTIEEITGRPAESVEEFVARRSVRLKQRNGRHPVGAGRSRPGSG
jgi:hypothetical protein